jgi:dihydrofolate synthase/folylpolyglutamate synthase
MKYEKAVAYLKSAVVFGIKPGLQRMETMLAALDNPERDCEVIHIAATNGKGSISAYAAHILGKAGLKVGWFTSPYLERFTERIRILDGAAGVDAYDRDERHGEVSSGDVARLIGRLKDTVDLLVAAGMEPPTEFELITAVAFLYFSEQKCDIVLLETGLGGRLDSTNVIDRPLAVIIGAIAYDHQDRLGSTIGEIASEKAGIMKSGVPVFAYEPLDGHLSPKDAEIVREVLRQRAFELSAPIHFVRKSDVPIDSISFAGQTFRFEGCAYTTQLIAPYQPMHAALALLATRSKVGSEAAAVGIAATRWPGRLEVLNGMPPTLIDGAHNVQGVIGLCDALDRLLADDEEITVMVGLLVDKEYDLMLKAFFAEPVRRIGEIYCTMAASRRAMPSAELAAKVAAVGRGSYNEIIRAIDDPVECAIKAKESAAVSGRRLICFGSLYLAGAVRQTLKAPLGMAAALKGARQGIEDGLQV